MTIFLLVVWYSKLSYGDGAVALATFPTMESCQQAGQYATRDILYFAHPSVGSTTSTYRCEAITQKEGK